MTIIKGCPLCSGCMCNCWYKFEGGKKYRKSGPSPCYYHQHQADWIEAGS